LVIDSSTKREFSRLSRELGNSELFWSIENYFGCGGDVLSIENAVSDHLSKKLFGGDFSMELSFIVSHFSEVANVEDLDFCDLQEILSDEPLCISDEDSLFDFVLDRQVSLFEFLSVERVRQFVEFVRDADVEINRVLLNRVFDRLVLPVDTSGVRSSRYARKYRTTRGKQFAPPTLDSLDGIIAHLTEECGGNVHDLKVVSVTSSGPRNDHPTFAAKNAVDLRSDSVFYSDYRHKDSDIPHTCNKWICYDFKDRRVVPTHYSISSSNTGGMNSYNLKSWVLEISENGEDWIEIDHKENNSELNDKSATRVSDVSRSEEGRFIRLVNIGVRNIQFAHGIGRILNSVFMARGSYAVGLLH
jgi:hypothetical protein